MAKEGSLDGFVDMLVDLVATRLQARVAEIAGTSAPKGKAKKSPQKGRKLDMRCRYPGCKNRSKGPRFKFLCDDHRKLPKKAVEEAMAKAAKK